jgi:hypothetical protein
MTETLDSIEALLPDYQYVDTEHNRIVVTALFTASFYFWGGHTPQKRQALVECIEAFQALYGEHLTWAFDNEKHRKVKLAKLPPLRQHVSTLDEDDCVAWYLASGEDYEEVSDYALSCLTERGWMNGDISSLSVQVPRHLIFETDTRQALMDFILMCHERLAPFHGNAGLSSVSTFESIQWEADILDVSTRYLTLFPQNMVRDKRPAPNGLKSIHWLTFIGNTLTERIGGPDAFVAYCRRFGVEPQVHGQGFMIQAGENPQLCPVGNPVPDAYLRINAALRPLRNGNFGSMGSGSINGEWRFDRCSSDLWIRRFDAPNIWPPAGLYNDLPEKPLGNPVQKALTLKTGEVCTVHGRYRHPDHPKVPPHQDDDAPHVVLLPGDVAPYWLNLGPHGEFLGKDAVQWELVAEL